MRLLLDVEVEQQKEQLLQGVGEIGFAFRLEVVLAQPV